MEILREKIELDNNDNYILFEQGGIGKTSQMKAVFRSYALSHKDGIVPIFVDCKTIDFNRKQPLLTHILLEFCGEDCPDNYENSIVRLENMLTKANSKYKYVFFIDGINECENNKYLVVQDIAKLLKSPNNKIIVSSRINENDIGLKDFKRLKVKEFTDAQIVTFLNSKGFKDNGNDVELNRLNPSLLKILRVPMFLKLFVETYSADNIFPEMYTSNIVRKADLLQAFIDKIFDDKKEQHSSQNDPEYIKRQFAMKRYLPLIAFIFMDSGLHSLQNEDLYIENSDFYKYKGDNVDYPFLNLNELVLNNSANNVDQILKIFNLSYKNFLDELLNKISFKEFALLIKTSDTTYSFTHQIWQDFFCGKFYELCIKYDVLEPFENAMPESVKQFIGEIIGECDFESKDNLDTEASPIEKFLQKHNLQQPENKQLSAIQTRNLVEIMKTSRNNNITADYSYLDLQKSDFKYSNVQNSLFRNSKLSASAFLQKNNLQSFYYVSPIEIGENGFVLLRGVYKFSKSVFILYNYLANESKLLNIAEYGSCELNNVTFSSDYNYVLGIDRNIVNCWNIATFEVDSIPFKYEIDEIISTNQKNLYLLKLKNRDVLRIEYNNGTWINICSFTLPRKCKNTSFSDDGNFIVVYESNSIYYYIYNLKISSYKLKYHKRLYITKKENKYVLCERKSFIEDRFTTIYETFKITIENFIFSNDLKNGYILTNSRKIWKIRIDEFLLFQQYKILPDNLFIKAAEIDCCTNELILLCSDYDDGLRLFHFNDSTIEYLLSERTLNYSSNYAHLKCLIKNGIVIIGGEKIDFSIVYKNEIVTISNNWKYVVDYNKSIVTKVNMHGILFQFDLVENKLLKPPIKTRFYKKNRICQIKQIGDSDLFVIKTKSREIYLYDVNTETELFIGNCCYQWLPILTCNSNSSFLVDNKLYDYNRQEIVSYDIGERTALCISPDGNLICFIDDAINGLVVAEISDTQECKIIYSVELEEQIRFPEELLNVVLLTDDELLYYSNNRLYRVDLIQYSFYDKVEINMNFLNFSIWDEIEMISLNDEFFNMLVIIGTEKVGFVDLNNFQIYYTIQHKCQHVFSKDNKIILISDCKTCVYEILDDDLSCIDVYYNKNIIMDTVVFGTEFINCELIDDQDDFYKELYFNGALFQCDCTQELLKLSNEEK